jgi:peroxiredoxin
MVIRNAVIAIFAVVCLLIVGIISLLPRNTDIQPTFIGKVYIPKSEIKPVLNIMEEGWYTTSEYAGRDVQFGLNKFKSGMGYTIPSIGIEETQDPWNYVNGSWFTWESADGVTYSIRMRDGQPTAYKMNNQWKPVDMMYTPTYGLGITRIVELFILSGIFNTEIMPFVSEMSRQIKYFSEETKPSDYYLSRDKGVTNDRHLSFSKDMLEAKKPIENTITVETKPKVYGTKIGQTAIDFEMVLLDGRKVNLSDYYGQKTVLNIWATWCGICITEFPVINEIYVQNKGVNVLAVCADGTPKQIQRIKDKYSTRYPCDFTMTSAIGVDKEYGLKGFPTTYFIDEYGIIEYVKIGGFSSYKEVEDILNKL